MFCDLFFGWGMGDKVSSLLILSRVRLETDKLTVELIKWFLVEPPCRCLHVVQVLGFAAWVPRRLAPTLVSVSL